MEADPQADIVTVQRIAALPSMLNAVLHTASMGFSAVARVTESRWIACGVNDRMGFGLKAGSELDLRTTICDEVRQHHQAVVIGNVADDPVFSRHPTPALYGFKSYISQPIVLPDGSFFGTLCAIDSKPNQLGNPTITLMFRLFAELIGVQVDAIRRLDGAVDRFMPRRSFSAASTHDHIADHLMLAQSLAASADLSALVKAIDIALYLTATNVRTH